MEKIINNLKHPPRFARRLSLRAFGFFGAVLCTALYSSEVFAGDNTKPVSIKCGKKLSITSPSVDPLAYGYSLIMNAAKGKKMDMEKLDAMGELDMLLTSSYGLRKPLATITNKRAAEQVAQASQFVMSGYVIAAQMMFGIIKKEALIPERTMFITGNMIYTMIEPDDQDPSLGQIAEKVRSADKELSSTSSARLPYARWLIRGYAYNDPVAVDAAMAGYCDAGPTKAEIGAVESIAKKVRLDPKKIVTIKG